MSRKLFDFEMAASVDAWSPIDDGVMGGISRSRLRHDAACHAVFEGQVSLKHNGGFASVRSHPLDLGDLGAIAYVIEVCGDGHCYKLTVRTDDTFDGVNHQAMFLPPAGAWAKIRLPLVEFHPTFRGRTVQNAPPLNPARVRQIGLMIADRQEGRFALAIRSIESS